MGFPFPFQCRGLPPGRVSPLGGSLLMPLARFHAAMALLPTGPAGSMWLIPQVLPHQRCDPKLKLFQQPLATMAEHIGGSQAGPILRPLEPQLLPQPVQVAPAVLVGNHGYDSP